MEPTNSSQYIRCFDLGGGGLKTALVRYDSEKNSMSIEGEAKKLRKCPDNKEISVWVREKLDLDSEKDNGFLFGFSLAGLDKLRVKPLSTWDVPTLFELPKEKVSSIYDGGAHLIASLQTLKDLPKNGRVWNIALGTGVGFGFTNSKHDVKPSKDLKEFFGCEAWDVIEPKSKKAIWEAGSAVVFDKILEQKGNNKDNAFEEYADRWNGFIQDKLVNGADWGKPQAVVFTGGHIEGNKDRLVEILNKKENLKVKVFQGPNEAGLIGAAWTAKNHQGKQF
jgi:hypothetical protein